MVRDGSLNRWLPGCLQPGYRRGMEHERRMYAHLQEVFAMIKFMDALARSEAEIERAHGEIDRLKAVEQELLEEICQFALRERRQKEPDFKPRTGLDMIGIK